jgi:hypothetical protein
MTEQRNNALTTRGRPFQPGNPGRPKGARHRSTVLAEKLMADDIEGIVTAVVKAAKDGDMAAARIILDRLTPVRRGRPVQFDLPAATDAAGVLAAFDAVLQAVAGGELTPEEGASITNLLEARRKAIETVELEARIAALETRVNQ